MKKENKHTEITRKEALKKMGKYAAFTAIGTFAVLNPLRAQETSLPVNPGGNTPNGNANGLDNGNGNGNNPAVDNSNSQIDKNQVKNNF
ncbi:hypothetical protein [Formosa sp. S-31]|uniref:hypothetical protein n=1 Tax=Formosa sp. S-31 TaxID=2790949 RepID=UPI003EBB5031